MTGESFDIVMLALPRWDGLYSSAAFSLAKELSRRTRVFYIDNPFTWKDYFLNRNTPQIKKRTDALRGGTNCFSTPEAEFPNLIAVTPELVYPVNWLPPGKVYRSMQRVNDSIVFKVIDKLIREFSVKKFVYVNSFDPLYGNFFPSSFAPALRVYHCVDDIRNSEYVSRHGTYLEKEIVKKSDLTIVTSMELRRLKSAETGSVYYLPNAADVELFNEASLQTGERPEELKRIPSGKKIIFYMGNICQRIDYDLMKKLAAERNYFIVMVGPLTHDLYRRVGLDSADNVIFTGRKSLRDLPSYLRFADCCIIPFRRIPLTKSIYPLKINEYLAAGKPVVTTDFSEDIINFGDVVSVSRTDEEFIVNVSTTIQTDSAEKRRQRMGYAAGNNWKARAEDFFNLIKSKIR